MKRDPESVGDAAAGMAPLKTNVPGDAQPIAGSNRPGLSSLPLYGAERILGWLLLLALPFATAAANSNWLYSSLGYLDPWFYFGYFLHLKPFKAVFFPNLYYGSRLPWILPGYVVHHLFDVLTSKYVLHFGFYYLAVFGMYCVLKRAVGGRNALLVAVLFGTHAAFLWAIGWDYVDGAGVTYNILALASMARAASSKRPALWIVLGGAAAAMMVCTNLFLVCFTPPVLFAGLCFQYKPDLQRKLKWLSLTIVYFVAGVILVTVGLGVINYGVDGNFWFYAPSISEFLALAARPNPWRVAGLAWLGGAYWLGIPIATGVASFFYLGGRLWRHSLKWGDPRVLFVCLYLFELASMIGWYLIGGVGLQLNYYVSYLLPLMFLAIGSIMATGFDDWQRGGYWFLIVAAAAAFACSLSLAEGGLCYRVKHMGLIASIVCAAVGLAVPTLFGKRRPAIAAPLLGLLIYQLGYSGMGAPDPRNSQTFLRLAGAADAVWPYMRGERHPLLFWYSSKEPRGPEFLSLNSIYLWGYSMISADFPSSGQTQPEPGRVGVLLSERADAPQEADRVLNRTQIAAEPLQAIDVARDGVKYRMTVFRLLDRTPEHLVALSMDVTGGIGTLRVAKPGEAAVLPPDKWTLGQVGPDGVLISMAKPRYTYGGIYTPLVAARSGLYRFTITYKVMEGGILFGGMTMDMKKGVGHAGVPGPSGGVQTVTYSQHLNAGEGVILLIASDPPGAPHTTRCLIESLQAAAAFDDESRASTQGAAANANR